MSEEGEGGLNIRGQKLAVTVQNRVTPVLPTQRRYYRGGDFSELKQYGHR
jgi:hypothetical protein